MNSESKRFITALQENRLDELKKVPKSDLHNHQSRGANKHDLEKWLNINIPPFQKVKTLAEMNSWYRTNIRWLTSTKETFEMKIRSAFEEAKRENLLVYCLSIGPGDIQYFDNSMEQFIDTIEFYRSSITPDITFIPVISICRSENSEMNQHQIDTVLKLLKMKYFKSIDLIGDENLSSSQFSDLYRTCKSQGLNTKTHIGEFTGYQNIIRALLELEVQDIQHGISASESPELMTMLNKRNITLHISPTSNLMLGRIQDYSFPQLRTFIDHGVKVTLNTDDLLIFDSSVSLEYTHLYKSGNFTAEELNDIRLHGLSYGAGE